MAGVDEPEKKKDRQRHRAGTPGPWIHSVEFEDPERRVGGDKGPIAYRKFPKWLMWVPYLLIAATIGVLVWLVLGSLGLVKPPWLIGL